MYNLPMTPPSPNQLAFQGGGHFIVVGGVRGKATLVYWSWWTLALLETIYILVLLN